MIEFHYEADFKLDNKGKYSDWLSRVIVSEEAAEEHLNYIFCTDEYLLSLNQKYLSHDTYTDIITFDYSEGTELLGDVFISVERVKENAALLNVDFEEELLRVMAHGILHLVGYDDKSSSDSAKMREKEIEKIRLFHVEQ